MDQICLDPQDRFPPPPLGHVNKTPPPQDKKCLWPPKVISGTALIVSRGGTLAILCVLHGDAPPSGVYVFHNFGLGRVLFSAEQSGKGTFFTVSVWEGCCFQAQQSGKGCVLILVWHWNSGKGCNFTLFFLLGRMGNFCLGRVRP